MFYVNDEKSYPGKHFIEDIINGMYDWVRVIDKDQNIIYLNKAMSDGIGNYASEKKCYAVLGKSSPCENCISRNVLLDGKPFEKEETFENRTFSVMSSPLKNHAGEIIAAVEVLRDVTEIKKLQQRISEQNNKLQQELAAAKKLQYSLLPWNFKSHRLSFSLKYIPCETLGGDFADIFHIDSDHIGIYIADVSGHGVSSSMLTVFLRSTIDRKSLSPSKTLEKLYKDFNDSKIFLDHYITVFYGIIDLNRKEITYSNAGHHVVPVIYNKNRLEFLFNSGIPISDWLPSPDYKDKCFSLLEGDRLFLCTDGIVEIRNAQDKQFGEEKLLEIIAGDTASLSETLDMIVSKASDFIGSDTYVNYYDDITMLLVELLPPYSMDNAHNAVRLSNE